MKRFVVRSALALTFVTAFMVFSVFPANAQTISHTPGVSPYPLFIATPLKGCAVTYITLRDSQPPTLTCVKRETKGEVPFTNITSCYNPAETLYIIGDQGTVCFAGQGYLGFHLTHVYEAVAGDYGWLKMYPSGQQNGFFFSFYDGYSEFDYYPFDGHHDITQICLHC